MILLYKSKFEYFSLFLVFLVTVFLLFMISDLVTMFIFILFWGFYIWFFVISKLLVIEIIDDRIVLTYPLKFTKKREYYLNQIIEIRFELINGRYASDRITIEYQFNENSTIVTFYSHSYIPKKDIIELCEILENKKVKCVSNYLTIK